MNPDIAAYSDALLERFVLGELDPERMEEVGRCCGSDPALSARVKAIRASDPLILEAYPPARMAASIRARRAGAGKPTPAFPAPFGNAWAGILANLSQVRFAAPALATLALGAILILRMELTPIPAGNQGTVPATVTGDIRLKGAEAGLAIFRKTRSGSELLLPHSLARPGDTLQVFYHSRQARYGMVFSVDGSGSVTLHFPETEGPAALLQAGVMLPLPHAFRLDRAPRFERFFLVTSLEPFDGRGLLASMRAKGATETDPADTLADLAPGLSQSVYTLEKEIPRKSSRKGIPKAPDKDPPK